MAQIAHDKHINYNNNNTNNQKIPHLIIMITIKNN